MVDEVGPQLGFQDNDQSRIEVVKEATDCAGEIVGQEHMPYALTKQGLDTLRTRQAGAGNQHGDVGMRGQEGFNQGCGCVHFAHGNGVEHDRTQW